MTGVRVKNVPVGDRMDVTVTYSPPRGTASTSGRRLDSFKLPFTPFGPTHQKANPTLL